MTISQYAIRDGSIIKVTKTNKSYYWGKYVTNDRNTYGCLSDLTIMLDTLEQTQSVLKEIAAIDQIWKREQREISQKSSKSWAKRSSAIEAVKNRIKKQAT
jgi:hypothetical protein